jgi:hypothetical protein
MTNATALTATAEIKEPHRVGASIATPTTTL